ncbi:hypothetical protein HJ590_09240 [Naumannella sp. ID2617S]|uniref:Uncharacterized protein n=1 Tax=Enemella dayhoffiae TaxID=2016507 RepID=A0A255HBM8_9ACTN|nr:hypothetical protein [Enemella dayhoffiae]NNG19756.1 hypothetical protein [Naumannella sp. ID2617S]OYO25011.1 hypothetical protein CGZ93_00640 [Enemella dayhoffiae]
MTSRITVDPGQIREFSKFLDEMTREIGSIRKQVHDYTPSGTEKVHFGEFTKSAQAAKRHHDSVAAGHDRAKRLHDRSDEITEATRRLAGQYDDLEELNGATAAQVTDELNRKRA